VQKRWQEAELRELPLELRLRLELRPQAVWAHPPDAPLILDSEYWQAKEKARARVTLKILVRLPMRAIARPSVLASLDLSASHSMAE
jgi:hypothetical protein